MYNKAVQNYNKYHLPNAYLFQTIIYIKLYNYLEKFFKHVIVLRTRPFFNNKWIYYIYV